MIDDVVLNKKVSLERCIHQVREYYALPREESFVSDYLIQDAIAQNLQRACQLCIDLANRIIRLRKLGLPQDSADSFSILHEAGILNAEQTRKLRGMVGFRNVLVHRYRDFDLDLMIDVIENRLDDLLEYAQITVNLLSSDPPQGEAS